MGETLNMPLVIFQLFVMAALMMGAVALSMLAMAKKKKKKSKRKLSPGIHTVTVNGKKRKVKVLKNGQWRFMKGSGGGGGSKKKKGKKKGSSGKKKGNKKKSSSSSGGRTVRKYKIIRLRKVVKGILHYSNLTGEPFTDLLDEFTSMIASGDLDGAGDFITMIMSRVNSAVGRLTSKPWTVLFNAALIHYGVDFITSFVGSVDIITLGKWKLKL